MYDSWSTFSLVAVPLAARDRPVAVIAHNRSAHTAALPEAAGVVQAAAITAAAATSQPTATESFHRAIQTGCERAGVRTATVRLVSAVIDTAAEDEMAAMEPQAAMTEQHSSPTQWIPEQDRRVATSITVTP